MACYVTLTLKVNAFPHSPLDSETRLNKGTTFAFSSSQLKRTSFASISSSCSSKCSMIQDLHSSRRIQVPCRNSGVEVSSLSNKVYCSRTISGYWVGPDSEDGWGFVQALVDEII